MTQTSTLVPDQTLKLTEKPAKTENLNHEPSLKVLSNILNYSRNLEVKRSGLLEHVEIHRS